MKMYLIAIVITLAATATIISACLFQHAATRAIPLNLYQLN